METQEKRAFYKGVRAAIAWLHAEALTMNDPHARSVLNNAAFHLGVAKPDPALAVADAVAERDAAAAYWHRPENRAEAERLGFVSAEKD